MPPPPEPDVQLIASLPVDGRPIAGIPDLMHHKYVIRDGADVWTGSLNWTDDSWSRQENVVAIVHSRGDREGVPHRLRPAVGDRRT